MYHSGLACCWCSVSAPQQELEGPAWTLEEYQKMFRNYEKEEDYEVLDIEGSIPLDLEGTFYRNGPGVWCRCGTAVVAMSFRQLSNKA